MAPENAVREIVRALLKVRVPATPGEYDLHALIAAAFDAAGLAYAHEARIAPRCRVDFLLCGVAVEVKKGKPARAALIKQALRYLSCPDVSALVVVTQKSVTLPREIEGKRVELVSLDRLWGVALP